MLNSFSLRPGNRFSEFCIELKRQDAHLIDKFVVKVRDLQVDQTPGGLLHVTRTQVLLQQQHDLLHQVLDLSENHKVKKSWDHLFSKSLEWSGMYGMESGILQLLK